MTSSSPHLKTLTHHHSCCRSFVIASSLSCSLALLFAQQCALVSRHCLPWRGEAGCGSRVSARPPGHPLQWEECQAGLVQCPPDGASTEPQVAVVLAALPYSQTVLCFVPVPRCVYTVEVEKPRSPKKTVCAVDTKHVEIPQTRSMDKVVDMLVVILWQVPTVQLSKAWRFFGSCSSTGCRRTNFRAHRRVDCRC